MKYQRLVEIYVKPELRQKIKALKQGLTYDQYLSQIFEFKEKKKNADGNQPSTQGKKSPNLPKRGVS